MWDEARRFQQGFLFPCPVDSARLSLKVNRFAKSILVLGMLAEPLVAEDPLELGLRGAFNAFAPVPEETARAAQSAATELLGPYLKRQGENHFCQRKIGPEGQWLELQGLKIQRVTAQAVTQADKANGIQEKLWVSLECEMYRSRKSGEASWSPWVNGTPMLFPPAISVEHGANGKWTASSTYLQYFNPIANPLPAARPQPAANPTTAGLPPGMSRAGSGVPPLPGKTILPTPQPPVSGASATAPPAPKIQSVPSPPNAGRPPVDPLIPAANPPVRNPDPAKPANPAKPLDNAMPFILATVVVVSVISQIFKIKRRPARPRNADKPYRNAPPPAPFRTSGSSPPPLPAAAQNAGRNPLDLIQRRDNLMTPAELAFFAVLEPLVRPTCMISSKVRLADLFDVRQERGQQAAFNKIVGKHIDFVLTDCQTSRILCAIELDDSSHNNPDRVERDRFVNELFAEKRLPLLRVPFSWTYYPAALREALAKAGLQFPESLQSEIR